VQEFDIPPGTDIVINATSIGSFDEDARVPVAIDTLEGAKLAADVVLHPTRTRFLDEAKSHGCEVLDGLAISVNQGALAFQLWTGVDPDLSVMQDALEEFFGV
ncbi:MAG: shikimate dehydrogenase, partial [Pirellulales bacterium]|nr:shikimate dehydrogenase [Pirellulales bacterium]